jgi:hypothetical protein
MGTGNSPMATFPDSNLSLLELPAGTTKSPAKPLPKETGKANDRRRMFGTGPANVAPATASRQATTPAATNGFMERRL